MAGLSWIFCKFKELKCAFYELKIGKKPQSIYILLFGADLFSVDKRSGQVVGMYCSTLNRDTTVLCLPVLLTCENVWLVCGKDPERVDDLFGCVDVG